MHQVFLIHLIFVIFFPFLLFLFFLSFFILCKILKYPYCDVGDYTASMQTAHAYHLLNTPYRFFFRYFNHKRILQFWVTYNTWINKISRVSLDELLWFLFGDALCRQSFRRSINERTQARRHSSKMEFFSRSAISLFLYFSLFSRFQLFLLLLCAIFFFTQFPVFLFFFFSFFVISTVFTLHW